MSKKPKNFKKKISVADGKIPKPNKSYISDKGKKRNWNFKGGDSPNKPWQGGLGKTNQAAKSVTKGTDNDRKMNSIDNGNAAKELIKSSTPVVHVSVPLFQKHNDMIIKHEMYWFEKVPTVDKCTDVFDVSSLTSLKDVSNKLWANEVRIHEQRFESDKSSDTNWLKTVLKSGTLSDKVAAYTMLLQESPVHATKSLEALMAMAKKKGRRESLISIDSLRHVWVTSLLPDRKLRHFNQWPLASLKDMAKDGSRLAQDRLLILILFEDYLKLKYKEFVDILETHLQDTLAGVRSKILGVVHELIALKAEEEQRLLKMIVNKIGDPERKVASRASFLLTELVSKHPNMKLVVAQEVERLLFRKNISEKAQYYGVCFLNQLILSSKEKELASKLISIFFSFFKVYASKAKAQSKMLSALLSGVNRAFPFAKGEDEKYEEQLNMLFRVSHVSKYGTSVQALMLLYQVMEVRQSVSDRFYQTVYELILNSEPKSTAKQAMFLNLLFKSMKGDPSVNRVKAFVKRLLQSCTHEQQAYVCGVLYLLSELLKERPELKSLLMQPEDLDDEEHFKDVTLDEDEGEKSDAIKKERSSKEDNEQEDGNKTSYATFVSSDIRRNFYDAHLRNPLYCGAQFSCAWESGVLSSHFHPSVQRFTETVVKNGSIDYAGDPLQDFTLMRFLDRFIYKNPKKNPKEHGRSIMQKKQISSRLKEAPVNSQAFMSKGEENVREDEVFFYKFFERKQLLEEKKKSKKREKLPELKTNKEDGAKVGKDVEDFDFASEMKKTKSQEKKKGKKKSNEESDNSEGDGSDFEMDEGDASDDFDYEDMEFSDEEFDEGPGGKDKKWSDKDYEKVLLDNLSSEEEEDGDVPLKKRAKKAAMSDTSLFAAADEFAHLLEEVQSFGKQSKETKWEESRESGKTNFDRSKKGVRSGAHSKKGGFGRGKSLGKNKRS